MPEVKKVKENDNVTLAIKNVTIDGDGLGELPDDGRVAFCFGGRPGEVLSGKVTKVNKNYIVVKKNGNISAPDCNAYPRCGGCSLRHFSYEETLRIKQNHVFDSITRIGKQDSNSFIFEDIIPSPEIKSYRNKTIYRFSKGKNGEVVCGFYMRGSHKTVSCESCAVENEIGRKIRFAFCELIKTFNLPLYDETTGKGLVRSLMVRTSSKTAEVELAVCINGDGFPKESEIVKILREKLPFVTSMFINVNKKATNTIFTEDFRLLFGDDRITDMIGPAEFKISPESFFQVNPTGTEKLYDKAVEYIGETNENDVLLDLYCGIGTIGIYTAKKTKLGGLLGIEYTKKAIENAKENIKRNSITCENMYFSGDAGKVLSDIRNNGTDEEKTFLNRVSVIVVDPPRKGLDDNVPAFLNELNAKKIVYVSCNPSTLARDIERFSALGWKLIKVCPVDMFPFAGHVETVVLLSKGVVDKENFRKVKVDFSLENTQEPVGVDKELRGKRKKIRLLFRLICFNISNRRRAAYERNKEY